MRPLEFSSRAEPAAAPSGARPHGRSVLDMIATRNAPLDPAAPPSASPGKPLAGMGSHECRFPVREEGGMIFFCAGHVPAGEWLPGLQHGCYCRFHRDYLRGCSEDSASRASAAQEPLPCGGAPEKSGGARSGARPAAVTEDAA